MDSASSSPGSIRRKIFGMLLLITLGTLILVSGCSFGVALRFRNLFHHNITQFGATAAQQSTDIITEEILKYLRKIASNKADLINLQFSQLQTKVLVAAEIARQIYEHPENYGARPLDYLQPEQQNVAVVHLETAPGVNYDDVKDEAAMLANLGDYFLIASDERTDQDLYFGAANGFSVSVRMDDRPLEKEFDARTRPWYRQTAVNGKPEWTDLFTDALSGKLAIAYTAPIYEQRSEEKILRGVLGAGWILIDTISTIVNEVTMSDDRSALLLDNHGQLVAFSNNDFLSGGKDPIGTDYTQSELASRRELAQRMMSGESGSSILNEPDGEELLAVYSPLSAIPWSVAVITPKKNALHSIEQMKQEALRIADSETGTVDTVWSQMHRLTLIGEAIILIASIISSWRLTEWLTLPLRQITTEAQQIASGDWDAELSISSNDEIGTLADTFNQMLKHVKTLAAAQAKSHTELQIAARIQERMLPIDFPRSDYYEVRAVMFPARSVGGDFYDFFPIGESHIAVAVADVSGKGIEAALFMASVKILLKHHAQSGRPLAEVFTEINRQICADNRTQKFVTIFMGVLNFRTGKFAYVNAGHNPPVLRRAGKSSYLAVIPGMVMGMFPETTFCAQSIQLTADESLFLYTDGVTEAENNAQEIFGADRLLTALDHAGDSPADDGLQKIHAEIKTFTGDAESSDDLTMLLLNYRG